MLAEEGARVHPRCRLFLVRRSIDGEPIYIQLQDTLESPVDEELYIPGAIEVHVVIGKETSGAYNNKVWASAIAEMDQFRLERGIGGPYGVVAVWLAPSL